MLRKLIYVIGCIVVFIFMLKVLFVLFLVLLGASSCVEPIDGCVPGNSICDGPTVLRCNDQGNWEPEYCWDDMNKICCEVNNLYFCKKVCSE